VSPAIQFTIEQETDDQLPFLDVLVMRDEDKLKTTVYKKKTHTNRSPLPLPPWDAGQSQLSDCENSDEESTSDQHLLKDELHHVQGVLRCNGYPKGFVRSNVNKEKEKRMVMTKTSHCQQQRSRM
jgi:hypothetical protein